MTEEEWVCAKYSDKMLDFIDERSLAGRGKARTRRLRLMRCSTFRLAFHEMPDDILRHAVIVAEQFADGECSERVVASAAQEIINSAHWLKSPYVNGCVEMLGMRLFRRSRKYLPWHRTDGEQEQIRDIFGNPFRPISFSPEWRTTTAVAIAQGMYDSRDFGPMPLLADALQDAGCEVPEIIDHCRGPGPHVRGCWVVDGVLGKS